MSTPYYEDDFVTLYHADGHYEPDPLALGVARAYFGGES